MAEPAALEQAASADTWLPALGKGLGQAAWTHFTGGEVKVPGDEQDIYLVGVVTINAYSMYKAREAAAGGEHTSHLACSCHCCPYAA